MIESTKAIVLHTIKCTGNSIILHCYTEMFGKLTFIINNTHSKYSITRNSILQPLSLLEIETNFIKTKEIQKINDCRIKVPFKLIPFDINRNALAIFMAEVIYRSQKEPLKDISMFNFLWDSVITLDSAPKIGCFHIAFIVQYLMHCGFALHPQNYKNGYLFDMQNGIFVKQTIPGNIYLNSKESYIISQISNINYYNMSIVNLSKNEKQIILSKLIEYSKLHLSNFKGLKSLDIIYQMFEKK